MERFILNQLVVDSGKDALGRPILAVYCCHFPDPEFTDYDQLLELSLKRLNRIVANEYILVVFTNPMDNSPSFQWMLEAYKSLKRDYKKNLKKLIMVHPSWWFKFIIGFMQNIVSSKFAKKIVNVDTIEDLEMIIETGEMMMPSDIRQYDQAINGEKYDDSELNVAKERMEEDKPKPAVFKVSLDKSCPDSDYPEEIKQLMEHLTNKGFKSDSIFRRSPNKEKADEIKTLMNKHQNVNFDNYDVYTLASVLKDFVRGLPDTLIPIESYIFLPEIMTMPEDEAPAFIAKNFVKPLDSRRKKLLKDLILLLAMTAQLKNTNRMSIKALAVVWAPNLIRFEVRTEEMKMINPIIRVVEIMIQEYDEIFCRGNKIW